MSPRLKYGKIIYMKNILLVNKKHLLIAGAVIILFFLVMDLNSRLVSLNRLSSEAKAMQTEVSSLVATSTALSDEIVFAQSDAAVDEWAREEGHMTRPGDVLVVPVAPPGATPVPVFVPTPTVMSVKNMDVWWALFFGD